MKAHVYRRNGEPAEVLDFEDIAAPAQPGPNEVTVRITKRMVHPIDDLMVRGYIPSPIPAEGTIPGGDGEKGKLVIRDLVKGSLRMRPDRIVIGECRSGEARREFHLGRIADAIALLVERDLQEVRRVGR